MEGHLKNDPVWKHSKIDYTSLEENDVLVRRQKKLFGQRKSIICLILLIALLMTLLLVRSALLHRRDGLSRGNVEETLNKLLSYDDDRRQYAPIFVEFADEYKRNYDSNEIVQRFEIFVENVKYIATQQSQETDVVYGLTKFADWSEEEIRRIIPRVKLQKTDDLLRPDDNSANKTSSSANRPQSFDWRTKKVVTHVKDQGRCGSCWSFATVAVVESLHAIAKESLVAMSEQQLIDCDSKEMGCNGGYRNYAMEFVRSNGLTRGSSYPYKAKKSSCQIKKGEYFVKSVKYLRSNEEAIADFVYKHGPVNVGLNVTRSFLSYRSGVFSPTREECERQSLGSHAVTIIGFGRLNGVDFWLFKNSWGTSWGMSGFGYCKRGSNACGIANLPLSAEV